MKREDAEKFTLALGKVVAGSWEQIELAESLGVPKALGLTTEQWIRDKLGGYVRLSVDERREAVSALAAKGYSNVKIAKILGVDEGTIRNDLKSENSERSVPHPQKPAAIEAPHSENSEPKESHPLDTVTNLTASKDVKRQARRKEKQGDKAERRAARERGLAEATHHASEALGQQLYNVILADPPWRFEPYSRETGMDRAADNHYPTESVESIMALNVADAAADNAALFLWATAPMLPQALAVMEAWGFQYKSHLIWAKDRTGMGYWARNRHELLLIGTRGDIPAPAPGTQPESLINAPVGRHSAKPDAFHEAIERIFPTVPKLEMFAREQRDGWDCWGNELEPADG